jgi:hypothetical protein
VIDTGAPLCVISRKVWNQPAVADHIEWLAYPPGAPSGNLPKLHITGRTYPFRLGRLPMEVFDLSGVSLPEVPVVAQLLEDVPASNRPPLRVELVLGLTHGVLDERYLVVRPAADPGRREAWLQEERPA